MYKHDDPTFIAPDHPEAIIWRFMDFTKLVSLLSTRSLFFSRLLYLEDPFEGSIPFIDRLRLDPQNTNTPELMPDLEYVARNMTPVNCWHINEFESAAMWKIYATNAEGIALRSTFNRLADAFKVTDRPIYIGKMRYINYRFDKAWEQGALNPFHFVLHKRMSFNYENELRAVADCNLFEDLKVYHKQNPQYFEGDVVINEGIFVPADLTALIEELVVSPHAKPWFVELVSSVMEHYDLGEIPVRRSDLYDLV